MSYTLGSLFDGSGGFPLAGAMCGITPKWCSEIEPYPIAVTCSRFPQMKHYGDVSKVNGAEVEPVDVITFGSPCQDLSVAGKRKGLKHEGNGDEETTRSGLFMEAVRIIKEMREATNGVYPRFALWENVPGAFSSNKGEDFRIVLEELIKIVEPTAVMPTVPKNGWPYADSYCGDGWSLAYRVFDAQYWGVPQRRRRIYLVLDLRGQRAKQVSFEREGVRGHFATFKTAWKGASGDAADCAGADDCEGAIPYTLKIRSGCEGGGKGALIQEDMSATLATNNDQYLFQPVATFQNTGQGWWNESGVGTTLRTPCGGDATFANVVVESIDGNILDDHGGQQITVRTDGKAPTLRAGVVPGVCIKEQSLFENHSQDSRYKGPLDVCPMLPARLGTGGNNQPFVVEKTPPIRYIVRRLTPTECARLQGFPDNWGHPDPKEDFTDEEYRFWLDVRDTHAAINGKPQKDYTKEQMLSWYNKLHTDSSEYKMWGNGIALPTALYVMQGIKEAMDAEPVSRGEYEAIVRERDALRREIAALRNTAVSA